MQIKWKMFILDMTAPKYEQFTDLHKFVFNVNVYQLTQKCHGFKSGNITCSTKCEECQLFPSTIYWFIDLLHRTIRCHTSITNFNVDCWNNRRQFARDIRNKSSTIFTLYSSAGMLHFSLKIFNKFSVLFTT